MLATKSVRRLPSLEGFGYNLKPPRKDEYALAACKEVFGESLVNDIEDTLHRSPISYEAMLDDLAGYDVDHVPSLRQDSGFRLIRGTVRKDLEVLRGKIVPLTMGAVPNRPDFPGAKSPGLPYKNYGYRTKREVLDYGHLHHINRMWQDIGRGYHRHLSDVCLFARAQLARKDKDKIRATWGFPIGVYMEEGRFFYPLQDQIKAHNHDLPIAYGYETANGGMSELHVILERNRGRTFACTDWKSFDKRIPPWLIRDAFAILEECFDMSHVCDAEGHVWEVNPAISRLRWKRMVDYFVETPIRTCKGERFLVTGGIPSGSCWTNLVDSIINILVTRFIVYETTGALPLDEIFLGDDGVFVCGGIVNLEDMAALAKSSFGMELNVTKSYVTTRPDNVHFLGYFNMFGYPFKPMDFLIASFINPEHTRKTTIDACAAALGQLWSSFDPIGAARWYRVIKLIADIENIQDQDIIDHLRANSYRHKYLQHVGISAQSLTVPVPVDGMILDVLPKMSSKIRLKPRRYLLNEVWCEENK